MNIIASARNIEIVRRHISMTPNTARLDLRPPEMLSVCAKRYSESIVSSILDKARPKY